MCDEDREKATERPGQGQYFILLLSTLLLEKHALMELKSLIIQIILFYTVQLVEFKKAYLELSTNKWERGSYHMITLKNYQ